MKEKQTKQLKTISQGLHFNKEKIELIKNTICKKATDEELKLFIHACQKTGLDPFMRQIFAVKRWDSSAKKEVMTIQTGIDGYRLIADRTGRYSPGKENEFGYEEDGNLKWAKAYVKKMTPDGKIGTVVPMHKELKIGTLKGLLKLADISVEEFSKHL